MMISNFRLVHSSTSLNCYVCSSFQNADCATAGKLAAFEQTCNVTVEPYCRRISQLGSANEKEMRDEREFRVFLC